MEDNKINHMHDHHLSHYRLKCIPVEVILPKGDLTI